jgi:cysteine desulfurase
MESIYLDYAASTPVDPQVVQEMLPYFSDVYGNPSSAHSRGQETRDAIEKARKRVADLIGAESSEIVFTSGGTEANNFALKGIAEANKDNGNHIITSDIEHNSIYNICKSLEISGCITTFIPVDKYGMVNPDDVKKAITPGTILISIMHANNEIGTIQPLAEITRIAHESGVYVHTDAVQTSGHIPFDVKELGIDLLSLSAHKLYGPKGVGALYIKSGVNIAPFIHGGGHESGRRAGTENVAGIAGFGKAAELAKEELSKEIPRQTELRNYFISELCRKMDKVELNGHPQKRLPNNVNLSFWGIEGEATLLNLDIEGVCVSTGSACSSESEEPSHVLLAIGLSRETARSSLRMTIGRWTTREQLDRVIEIIPVIVARLRAMSPIYKQ